MTESDPLMSIVSKLVLASLAVVVPALFWLVYFLPARSEENWFPIFAMFYVAPFCLLSIAASLHLARKTGLTPYWWMLTAYCFSPILWTVTQLLIS